MNASQMKKLISLFSLIALGLFFFGFNPSGLSGVQAKNNSSDQLITNPKILKLFDDLQDVIISVSNTIKPAVVHIEVVQKSGQFKYKSLASGLIVDERGYILTNDHVVDKAQSITVTLASKIEYPAEIIGTDKQTDLAVIQIKTQESLFVAKLGNSDEVKVGEWVIAVGNPYGFDRTVSFGIVSGKGRVFPNLPLETQLINDFIQTDAAIDPGSSGGPLVNLKGEVIGINSIGFGRGQGFTIPINTANEVKNKLLTTGTIDRGWIGIVIQPLSRDYAKYYNKPDLEGILIGDVIPDSPAEKAGLLPGDIIVEYMGEKVSAEKEEDLNKFQFLISQSKVGEPALIKIVRYGVAVNMTVEVARQPKVKADEYETSFGFTVKEITDAIYRDYMLEDKEGVLVSYVEVGGAASTAQLQEDDIIIKVGKFEIKNLDDFKKSLEQVKNEKQIMLTVKRGKNKQFVLLLPEEEKKEKTE
ncbi:MAG: trypsin-like peptidase domain-containing protein [candidate division Zixibacteria bacterium]|nr:trypsin-like peptidase domain-containing protein [candidate division Zixibacteria bacterium]